MSKKREKEREREREAFSWKGYCIIFELNETTIATSRLLEIFSVVYMMDVVNFSIVSLISLSGYRGIVVKIESV